MIYILLIVLLLFFIVHYVNKYNSNPKNFRNKIRRLNFYSSSNFDKKSIIHYNRSFSIINKNGNLTDSYQAIIRYKVINKRYSGGFEKFEIWISLVNISIFKNKRNELYGLSISGEMLDLLFYLEIRNCDNVYLDNCIVPIDIWEKAINKKGEN